MNTTRQTKFFIGAICFCAILAGSYAASVSHSLHAPYAIAVMALAAATSRLRVKLPGINGNMSVNLPFLLIAVVSLSAMEVIMISCVSTAVQCWPSENARLNPQHLTFNLSMITLASCMASLVFHAGLHAASSTLSVAIATATMFLGQTVPVAGIVSVSESKALGHIWAGIANLSFPYYVVSAGVTSMIQVIGSHLGYGMALAIFPVMYAIYRSYRTYFTGMAKAESQMLAASPKVMAAVAGAR